MADESTQQKTSPTLTQIGAHDHSEMLLNALNINPAKAMREALATNQVAKAMSELHEVNPAAKAMREALAFDPFKAMEKALPTGPYESIHNAILNLGVYERPVDRTVGFWKI